MPRLFSRRHFLAASAATGCAVLAQRRVAAASPYPQLKKSLIGAPDEKTLRSWQEAGFDGMESRKWDLTPAEAEKSRRVAETLGMRIHSVLFGWANFNSPDASVVEKDLANVEVALRASQGFGADALLLVPCRVNLETLPKPEEFDIEFNPHTGHVKRVVRGDNSIYEPYITAQNLSTDASRRAVEKLIPVAEKTGVVIALENVWNNLWVKPDLFANFVASFKSPWVKCYFDIGNHVKYAMPEEWIRALGKLIVKVHIKDFTIDRAAKQGGQFVDIRDGDVNWPLVREELAKIDYIGWMTIEGSGGLSLDEQSKRLDLIINGK